MGGLLIVLEQAPDVTGSANAVFPPNGVPIRAMGAGGAAGLAAFDHLAPHSDLGPFGRVKDPVGLELGLGEDQQPTQIVCIEVAYCVKQVAVERQGRLGHFEWEEEPGDGPAIGQGPTARRAETGGMVAAQGVGGNVSDSQVLDPHVLVGIRVHHHGRGR